MFSQHPYLKSLFRILLIVSGMLFLRASFLFSQDTCATKIQEAQRYYDQGIIEEIPRMLAPCMESGFTRGQRIEAYKLIILAYLVDDNQFDAEKTMLEFLKKYPEYEILPNDPPEFVYLFESFRTTSVFSFGINAGFNFTDPRIIEPYTMFDRSRVVSKNTMSTGFQVGIGAGRYITRHLQLNLEFNFVENHYSFTDEIRIPLTGGNDGINLVNYTERLYKFEFPLTLSYEFSIKRMFYYVNTGFSASKITAVNGLPSRKYSDELPPLTGEKNSISDYRRNMLYSAVVGAGMRFKVPRGVVMVGLRANIGLNNIVKSDKRYDNHELSSTFYYLDDDFSLNTFSFSASYYFSFYTPKKQR
jgi:hypothetical protein